jgi:hypothetical protein
MVDQNELFENLKAWILQLPGVTQTAHRFGGTEFQVDGLEFMHHHGPSFLDIRLSKSDQATVLKSGTALAHRFAPQAGWVASESRNRRISTLPKDSSSSDMKTRRPAWKPTEQGEANREV